jgi:hypothetical protein
MVYFSESATLTWLHASEISLLLFGLVLVLGLIGEYQKSEKFKKRVHVFELMVVIGVGGELVADCGVLLFTEHLQTIADGKIAKLSGEAQKFRDRADALESQMTDRHITPDQRKRMIEILGTQRGAKVTVGYITGSGEDALKYSLELARVFCDAEWHVFQLVELVSSTTPVHGFLIDSRMDSPSSRRLAGTVRRALAVTGYDVPPQKPTNGFQLGGNSMFCGEPPSPIPSWHPTDIEVLVGGR